MRLLLDTHVVLWWINDSPRLRADWREMILRPTSDVLVSVATLWEIVVKTRTGKLKADLGEIEAVLEADRFQQLAISSLHLKTLASLPAHHRDPFDLLLIAQAISEDAILFTEDRVMRRYPIKTG